jgi:phosphoglycolate phosphatase
MPLKLVVFDVDGTLVDSQAEILAAMRAAFAAVSLPAPDQVSILGIVGLSLDRAMEVLMPEASSATHVRLVEEYKSSFQKRRLEHGAGASPLFPGAQEVLDRLLNCEDVLMGIATGKSKRGLDALFEAHNLSKYFVTTQVADHHPSKPNPSMLLAALQETGTKAGAAMMIGDTSYDMEMARAAGMRGIGVSWGYHSLERLAPVADTVINRFLDLLETPELAEESGR